jgi:hypothetical protein
VAVFLFPGTEMLLGKLVRYAAEVGRSPKLELEICARWVLTQSPPDEPIRWDCHYGPIAFGAP